MSDALVKCTTMHHLIDEVDLLLVFVHFYDLADVWMVELLQELDLFQELATLAKLQIFLTNNLDSACDSRDLVYTTAHTAQSTLTNRLMQLKVILDVVLMTQIEFFGVQLDRICLIWLVISAILQKVLEVLAAKCDHLFRLLSNDLFNEVLEDAGEGIGHIDLLSRENAHLTDVGHAYFNISFDLNLIKTVTLNI